MKHKGRFALVIISSVVLVGILVAVFQYDLFRPRLLTKERVQELRAMHPVSYLVPANVNMIELSFSDILDISPNAVVVAEVIKKMPDYTVDLMQENIIQAQLLESSENVDSLENNQMVPLVTEASFTPYQVSVEEVIVGKMDSEVINISYNSAFANSEPDLQSGSKIVVAVAQAPSHPVGTYGFTKYGTYYVVDEHYVLSAYESKE